MKKKEYSPQYHFSNFYAMATKWQAKIQMGVKDLL